MRKKKNLCVLNWKGKDRCLDCLEESSDYEFIPCPEESVNFDTTENLFFECDNLDALKYLQQTHLNKIKCIYIDPPYNTGQKRQYKDDFGDVTGCKHSDWLNMMYPRLVLARGLLSEDGVIFISIDDNEQAQLKMLCDEVFGEENFVGCICRATGTTTGQDANKIGSSFDYCQIYSKSCSFRLNGLKMDEEDIKRFNEQDERGIYSKLQLRKTGNNDKKEDRPNMFYPVISPDGTEVYPAGPTGYLSRWRVSQNSYHQLLDNNMIVWKENKDRWIPYVKYYLEGRTKQVSNLLTKIEGNKKGTLVLKNFFRNEISFNNPKPVGFTNLLLEISSKETKILICDYFAGSGTTAHSTMKLNAEDGGKRKFILCQTPDPIEGEFSTIAEICKERMRRAGKKVLAEAKYKNIDVGFQVWKVKKKEVVNG